MFNGTRVSTGGGLSPPIFQYDHHPFFNTITKKKINSPSKTPDPYKNPTLPHVSVPHSLSSSLDSAKRFTLSSEQQWTVVPAPLSQPFAPAKGAGYRKFRALSLRTTLLRRLPEKRRLHSHRHLPHRHTSRVFGPPILLLKQLLPFLRL